MNWTEAYFRYKMFCEIAGGAIVFIGIALVVYNAIYEERKKK